MIETRLGKFTLPSPVTGSHPTAALKPAWQHVAAEALCDKQQLLLPDVISLKRAEDRLE